MSDGPSPNHDKKIKVKSGHIAKRKMNYRWIVTSFLLTFALSITISMIANLIVENVSLGVAYLILLIIISIGITFDILGLAVTAAAEPPFHAMASNRVFGASTALWLIRNAEKVSNFCNDIIGDICGVISGALGSLIAIELITKYSTSELAMSLVVTGLVAALTVGGKAIGKTFALTRCNNITYGIGKFLYFFSFKKHN